MAGGSEPLQGSPTSPKQQDDRGGMYDCLLASTDGWTIVQPLHSLMCSACGVNVCRWDRGGASAPPRPSRTEASAYLLLLARPLQPPRLVERVEVGSSLLVLKPTNRASRMPPSAYSLLLARRRVEQVEQGRRASRSSRTPPAAYSLLLAGVLRPSQRVE